MRKKGIFLIFSLVVLSHLVLAVGIGVMAYLDSPKVQIAKALEGGAFKGELVSQYDDYAFSDGKKVYCYTCKACSLTSELENLPSWQKFPLDYRVHAMLYGLKTNEEGLNPYLTDEAKKPLVPEITEGYWYLEERKTKEKNSLPHFLPHFTLLIYDTESDLLYYIKADI